jgi:hypothetical protein
MPDIRYVCLSDLHFGAENSILSCLVPGEVTVDPTRPSATLDALVQVLDALIGANEHRDRKPTLILNGDVLELALANDNDALMVFELFLDRVFPADGEALFDRTVLYQPGNHDHHLWETARERQYGDLVRSLPPDALLPIPWHSTRMYFEKDPQPVQSTLLDQLAGRRPRATEVSFRVSYPNMGVRSADGSTAVVFHHGHFVESIYLLMTTLKDLIFPGRAEALQAWDWEAENFAWIDFFWSTLGRSGEVGADVGLIYDMLQSDAAMGRLAANVSAGIAAHWGPAWKRWAGRVALRPALRAVLSRVATSERRTPSAPLSVAAQAGLLAYLRGPLLRQLGAEAPPDGSLPEQVKLVFGHTHKPFVESRSVPGFARPVRIFNTGGWVVDTLDVEPLHGANLVLVDENLEVAAVRLYNQATGSGSYRVRLDAALAEEQGPFYRRLSELVRADDDPWKGFSDAVSGAVPERQQALGRIITAAGRRR